MSETSPAAEGPRAILLPQDLDIILKLLPRAQIVVGDIPRLYPTLQRIEAAVRTGKAFLEDRPPASEVAGD